MRRIMIRKPSTSLLTITALMLIVNMVSQAQSLSQARSLPPLTHHMREAIRTGGPRLVGQLPSNQVMTLDVVLPLRDQAGLNSFLKRLYDPGNPSYRHFLSVPEFTERFGPSQENYDAVVNFVRANGFAVVGGTRD